MRHLLLLGAQARGHTWSQAEAAYFYPNLLRPLRKDLHVADLGHGGTFRFGLLRSPTRSLKEDTLNRSAIPSLPPTLPASQPRIRSPGAGHGLLGRRRCRLGHTRAHGREWERIAA